MNELTSSIISGIVGGLVVWGIQQWYSNRREKKKLEQDLLIAPVHSRKIVTAAILETLKPGRDINLMFETLGQPAVRAKNDSGVFSDETIETNSYLYFLKNAYVKITSRSNEVIDSLTVFPYDKSIKLEHVPNPFSLESIVLNETKIRTTAEGGFEHTVIVARHDETFAVKKTIVNPLNLQFTYFGLFGGENFMGNWRAYKLNNDPNAFISGILTGICISGLDEEAFYIYAYEV